MNLKRRTMLKTALAMSAIAGIPNFANAGGKVNFFNWEDFIGEENLPNFTKKTGINVKESFFSSDSELFSKLLSKKSGYDVVVPSGLYMGRLINGGLLEKLDHSKIPNMKNLADAWKNVSYDPGHKYSVPFLWGTTGLGYNSKVTGDTDMADMKWILESSKFSGRIAWMNSEDEMYGAAEHYLNGSQPQQYDPKLVAEAHKLLMKQKKHIKVFAPDSGQDLLLAGDVDVAIEYNGDIGQISREDPAMKYVAPTNGGSRWVSILSIAKNAPNKENAHKLINHLLDGKESWGTGEYTEYAIPNAAGLKYATKAYKNDPAMFPPEDVVAKLPFGIYLGEEYHSDIAKRWIELKSA